LPQLRDLQLERAGAGVELAGTEPKTPETSAESAADTGRSREPQIPTIPATKTTPEETPTLSNPPAAGARDESPAAETGTHKRRIRRTRKGKVCLGERFCEANPIGALELSPTLAGRTAGAIIPGLAGFQSLGGWHQRRLCEVRVILPRSGLYGRVPVVDYRQVCLGLQPLARLVHNLHVVE
jgi:hypothetical protein